MRGPHRTDGYLIYNAGGTISAFHIGKLSAAQTLVVAAAATDELIGAVQNSDGVSLTSNAKAVQIPAIGQVGKVKAGAAIAEGEWLTSDATGRAVPIAANTSRTIGRAKMAATAADEIITYEALPLPTRA